jgi:2-polyprenyl-3-methyl-5-hydroxy-6-metoxy-1,4-benzoquinol methylase
VISDEYFDKFQTKKYRAKNPVKRRLIARFVDRVTELFHEGGAPRSVLEIGVGEGFLSGHLSGIHPGTKFSGVDIQASDLELLRAKFPQIEAHQGSIYDLSGLPGGYDLIICAEVLEHLERPEEALDQIVKLAPERVLLTVPHEPWFMLSNLAMGKNVRRFGNDAEHCNHFTVPSFRKLLSTRFDLTTVTTSYPWILATGRPKPRVQG